MLLQTDLLTAPQHLLEPIWPRPNCRVCKEPLTSTDGEYAINPSFALSVNYVEQFNVQVQTGGGVPIFGDCVPGNPFSGNVRSE
jgi:hypothetical protein